MKYEVTNYPMSSPTAVSVELGQSLVESRLELTRLFGQCGLTAMGIDWQPAVDEYVNALSAYLFEPVSVGFVGDSIDDEQLAQIAAAQIGVMLASRDIGSRELDEIYRWFDVQTDGFAENMHQFLGALAYLHSTSDQLETLAQVG